MFDFHIHTNNSHDSRQTIDEVCIAATERGLKGIAICDHVDMGPCYAPDTYENMIKCINEVKAARQKYGIEIYQGIELAEYLLDTEGAEKILALCDYDVILGSVHYVPYENHMAGYSSINFANSSMQLIKEFLTRYFNGLLAMAEKVDFDVLTHLTCPIRYINGKYKRGVDIMGFKNEICSAFELIIKRDIALEINTSGIGDALNDFMPCAELLRLYKELGGKLVTIGSDAHAPNRVGAGLVEAKELLKSEGFDSYYYYKNRTPQEVEL